jgi:hypothetical protein
MVLFDGVVDANPPFWQPSRGEGLRLDWIGVGMVLDYKLYKAKFI